MQSEGSRGACEVDWRSVSEMQRCVFMVLLEIGIEYAQQASVSQSKQKGSLHVRLAKNASINSLQVLAHTNAEVRFKTTGRMTERRLC